MFWQHCIKILDEHKVTTASRRQLSLGFIPRTRPPFLMLPSECSMNTLSFMKMKNVSRFFVKYCPMSDRASVIKSTMSDRVSVMKSTMSNRASVMKSTMSNCASLLKSTMSNRGSAMKSTMSDRVSVMTSHNSALNKKRQEIGTSENT